MSALEPKLGVRFILTAPDGYGFDDAFAQTFREQFPETDLEHVGDPLAAVRGADVIYTDVWTSMGQEEEHEVRLRSFANYQVNAALRQSHRLLAECILYQ